MISFVRKFASRWYVGVALASSVFVYSCQPRGEKPINKDFTGEELFKGIFFGEGEVANMVPEISNRVKMIEGFKLNQEELDEIQAIRVALITKLTDRNSNFFIGFKTAMQSGQHVIIEKALKETSDLLFQGVQELADVEFSMTKEQLLSKINETINLDEIKANNGRLDRDKLREQLNRMQLFQSGSGKADAGACLAIVVIIAAVVAAIAIAGVIVFIMEIQEVNSAAQVAGSDSQLQQEMMVNSIAVSLALN